MSSKPSSNDLCGYEQVEPTCPACRRENKCVWGCAFSTLFLTVCMSNKISKSSCQRSSVSQSMVLWSRVAAASPVHTSRLHLEFAHSWSCRTRQRSVRALFARKTPPNRSQGVQICAKLPLSRKLQVASAILAGALAVWVSRNTTLSDLPADNQGASDLSGQPVAYQGGSRC